MTAVRRLASGDVAGLRAMNAVFAEGFGDPESYAAAPLDAAWAAQWLANPNHIALLAKANGVAVGALAAYVLPKFEQARSEIYIYDLAVLESARRQGIATALIDALRAIARDIGAWTIFVQADIVPEDEPARRLYRKLASEEITALHFDIAP
ncbi:GNAT family N-acetyltransferase [Porphyrobacter sp. AAP82]|uniref:GNAT family N-acetyltransferase n=1 Tax=Porphyrobacter sp. AAP82 TaxID=1248917 RepID=UPI000306170E|nr:GNAT family N-acetyltransferase [Porphyrobacter sp. AAP82]